MFRGIFKGGESMQLKLEGKSSWTKIKESGLPVVIYGMGNGADKVIDEFNRLEIPILGVTASDAFVRGQSFRGFTVRKLSEFEGEFIIAVCFASSLPDVTEHIFSLCEKYRVLVPCVPVVGNEIFNDGFFAKNQEKLNTAYNLFDDCSKRIYEGCVNFIYGGELDVLKSVTTEKSEAFGGFFKPAPDEDYLDLGAYRGDTVDELLEYSGGTYSSIIAVEPDRRTFRKLTEHIDGMENVTALQKAVYRFDGVAAFNSAAGRQSAISDKGEEIDTVTIDEICKGRKITYIKFDVEGAEYDALCGGEKTISTQKPKLNVALYHKFSDLFELPLKIHSLNPDYEFHLRKHPYIPCWDLNLYCI